MQCNSDTILVEWEITLDTPLYLVTAEGHDQSLISCNSSSSFCELQDVRCGMQYSIIVSASSDKCSSLRSPPKKIKTAPCVPDNVTVVQLCEERGAAVAWAPSIVATSYHLTATDMDGSVASYNTSVNNFTLVDLHCGQWYSISITARGDNCTSKPRTSSFRTVPCEPSILAVDFDCENNSAVMSWNASEGAVEYFGCAQSDGEMLYCNSTDSSCTLEGLECGKMYNFSVEASDGICNMPCPPTSLKVKMQKIDQNYWARTSWDSVNCSDVEYLAEITGRINNDPLAQMQVTSYWLPRRYFEFKMPCSTAYNLTVRARNSVGVSAPSSAYTGITAPCPPQNVIYSGSTRSALLSWDASVFATTYTVYSTAGGRRMELCSTTTLSCQLTNFNASTTEVTASNDVGESNPNRNITGPVSTRRRRDLRATEVYAHLDKELETPELLRVKVSEVSLHVKWTTVIDATEYTVVIEEEQREQQATQPARVRTVEGDSYVETDLKPWTTYCVRVAAKNAISRSDYSRPECKTTDVS
ncbi:hypothetical protein INR49_023955 [Caranx melampygus]|nr:hypothetical protein INR49_023955 [Caranx melampygus]